MNKFNFTDKTEMKKNVNELTILSSQFLVQNRTSIDGTSHHIEPRIEAAFLDPI